MVERWNSEGEQWNSGTDMVEEWNSGTVMVDEWNRYGGMVE